MSAIESTVDEQAEAERQRERELAAVDVSKDDVDLIVGELEVGAPASFVASPGARADAASPPQVPKEVADRTLRIHKGDVVAALSALVNAGVEGAPAA